MSNLSQIDSNGLGNPGRFSNGSMSSSQVAVNSYESLEAGLTIQTREGDVVSLSTRRYSELDAHEYSSQGQITNGNHQVSAAYNVREITLSSGEAFSFSVQGDLSEEELQDIEAIVSGIDEIIGEMAQGDMDDAISKAMSMGSYDSISMYEADISVERSYAMYAQTQSEAYTSGRALGRESESAGQLLEQEPLVTRPTMDTGPSFLDKIAEMLEEQREEAVARSRQPLSQLLDHHMTALADAQKEDDATEEIEEQPMYSLLETAAKDIDQMINEMVKDIFKNTLSRII